MTSPILPFDGPSPFAGLSHPMSFMPPTGERSVPTGNRTALGSELSANDRAYTHEADSGTPPAEVLDQIAAAGRISRQLSESGHELRFSKSEGGRVTVELADHEGNTVRSMSISEALEIAVAGPLPDATVGPSRNAGREPLPDTAGGPSRETAEEPSREAARKPRA